MPAGDRQARNAWGQAVADLLGDLGEVYYGGLTADYEAARRINDELRGFRPDAFLLAPSMPGPADFTWQAMDGMTDTPVVMWAANQLETLSPAYGSADHIGASVNVGVNMIGNVLVRHGHRPMAISGRWSDPVVRDAVRRAVSTAAVAGMLRSARLGVLGAPMAGYTNVTVDGDDLRERIGATLVEILPDELADAYADAGMDRIEALVRAVEETYAVDANAGDEFRDSIRLTLALAEIVSRHRLDAGTFNSNLDFSRLNPKIGLVGGLPHCLLTTVGVPFTETGDIITAVAMFLGKRLAGDAFYGEINMIDHAAGAFLSANTGEGDFANAVDSSECHIFPTRTFTGRDQRGCIVDYELRRGPVTVIGFTPTVSAPNGYRIVCMAAENIGRPNIDLHVPHSLVRPLDLDVTEAFSRWAEAGATHHASYSRGDLRTELKRVGDFLGIETISI